MVLTTIRSKLLCVKKVVGVLWRKAFSGNKGTAFSPGNAIYLGLHGNRYHSLWIIDFIWRKNVSPKKGRVFTTLINNSHFWIVIYWIQTLTVDNVQYIGNLALTVSILIELITKKFKFIIFDTAQVESFLKSYYFLHDGTGGKLKKMLLFTRRQR